MTKSETIKETGKILRELAFLMKIDDYPNTIPFIKTILEFMEEEFDEESCETIRVKFKKLKEDRELLLRGR